MKYTDFVKETGGQASIKSGETKSQGIGKNIGGILGGTIGQILGTPADVVTGPGGTMAGGAAGGYLGGAAGETIDQILSGGLHPFSSDNLTKARSKPIKSQGDLISAGGQALGLDTGKIGRAGAEQAAYGAIPVGNELRAIPLVGKLAANLAGRTVLRGGAGAVGSIAAQEAVGGDVDLGQAGLTGLINAAAPGLSSIPQLPGKASKFLGGRAIRSGETELESRARAPQGNIEIMLGRDTMGTENGKISITKDAQRLIDEGGLSLPPNDYNPASLKAQLKNLSSAKEAQLTPILEGVSVKTNDTLKPIVKANLKTSYGIDLSKIASGSRGSKQAKAVLDKLPPDLKEIFTDPNKSVSLQELRIMSKNLNQRIARDPNGAPASVDDKFLEGIRSDINKSISENLDTQGNKTFSQVFKDHSIIEGWKDQFSKFVNSGTKLPESLSKQLGEEGTKGLSGERKFELVLRAALTGGPAAVGILFPGLSPEMRLFLTALSGAAGAAEFAPKVFPQQGIRAGEMLQKIGNKNLNVDKILQQVGVRLPSLLD